MKTLSHSYRDRDRDRQRGTTKCGSKKAAWYFIFGQTSLVFYLSLSLSCCVWPCGRLISINVETNLKCENRKPKTENRIRMRAQQIKIKIKVCRGVSRTGNCELGTFLTHIIWWFYDFTTHISSGRLTTFLVGTVGIGLFTSSVRGTNWVSFGQIP